MVRALSAILLASFACARMAAAQWQIVSQTSDATAAGGVEHRHVVAQESANGARATLEIAVFATKNATLRVIDNPGAEDSLGEIMRREKCIAGVNGGYFDPQYAPVGLMISDGRALAPQQKARLLSGVVSVAKGRVCVQRAAEFSARTKPTAARQCGPFLVDRGQAVPGLNNARSARRTFVGTIGAERAAIGYCSYVTLAQLASLLATPGLVEENAFARALNLDGGSSSGFWFAGSDGAFSISEQKSVRDFLAIVPK